MLTKRTFRTHRAGKQTRLTLESLEHRLLLAGPDEGGSASGSPIEMTRFQSAEELEQFLVEDAVTRWEGLFGQPAWPWGFLRSGVFDVDVALGVPGAPEAADAPDHSDTNTQVAGVDEGDIVETDGNFLYILAGQEVVIAQSWPQDQLQVASRVEIDGQPFAEYLAGDRLTVLSYSYDDIGYPEPWIGGAPIDALIDVAYPYPYYEPSLSVTVLDVSDRSAPSIVQQTDVDGNYVDSRAIGDFLYLVTSDNFGLPAPEAHCEDNGEPKPGEPNPDEPPPDGRIAADVIWFPPDSNCVYESREQYLDRIAGQVLELGMPNYTSTGPEGDIVKTGLLTEATSVYKPTAKDHTNLMSVSSFNMAGDEPGPVASSSVPTTYSTEVYASTGSLYLVNPDWGWGWNETQAASLYKFDVDSTAGAVDLVAVGNVPGRTLNSFSIDEHDGYLRIATTDGFGRETENRVYVLQQTDDQLEVVGRTERLAPGEQIFSVRFMNDTAYVVTFLRVDPLFTLDMSDPTNPQVRGELKIPGFSNYLHPFGEDYLIGIGNDADESTGRVKDLQVSLFNVSDLDDPRLADRFTFEVPGWAWSEATSDHHAVGFYPEHQVLAIPISNGGGWEWIDRNGDGRGDVQTYRPYTELWVFQLNVPDGENNNGQKASIELLGQIEHESQIRRSVRIEDFLYSISDRSVTAHEILNPDAQVGQLHFGQDHVGVPVFHPDENDTDLRIAMASPEQSAPQVVNVALGSTRWDRDFVNFLDAGSSDSDGAASMSALPFSGIDRVTVTFSEDVFVGREDLSLRGANVSNYGFVDFRYDADISTAVWTLASPFEADKLYMEMKDAVTDTSGIALDGNSTGSARGRFEYRFNVLPGEVNGDGRVDNVDVVLAMTHPTSALGDSAYSLARDINGNGTIDSADFMQISNLNGITLPERAPTVRHRGIAGDANDDGRFDQRDVVQVLQAGRFTTGQAATWREGDWTGDGLFNQLDIVTALQAGHYLTQPQAPGGLRAAPVDELFAEIEFDL